MKKLSLSQVFHAEGRRGRRPAQELCKRNKCIPKKEPETGHFLQKGKVRQPFSVSVASTDCRAKHSHRNQEQLLGRRRHLAWHQMVPSFPLSLPYFDIKEVNTEKSRKRKWDARALLHSKSWASATSLIQPWENN